ncbi:MAG: hypothetical protein WB992_11455, partial [Bryobacteraceae bacterium]
TTEKEEDMPTQEEHDEPENLVDSPHQAEHTARTLEDAADSLESYYAINNRKPSKEAEKEIEKEQQNKGGI